MQKCPGQDSRYWTPEDVKAVTCDGCGRELEFFKTDGARRCPACGARVVNPLVSLGCAQWCQYAKECLGFDPKTVLQEASAGDETLANMLIEAVKKEASGDEKRIAHALRVLDHAEAALKETEEADPRAVIAAALLHGAAYGDDQERCATVRKILNEIHFDANTVERVCAVTEALRHGTEINTPEFKIVQQADRQAHRETDASEGKIERDFKHNSK